MGEVSVYSNLVERVIIMLDEQVKILSGGDVRLDIRKEGLRKAMKTHTGHLETDLKFETGVPKCKYILLSLHRHARSDEYRIVSMVEVQNVCLKFYRLFQQKI